VLLFIPAMDTAMLSLGAGGRPRVRGVSTHARWWVPARPEAEINRESMLPSSSSTVGASLIASTTSTGPRNASGSTYSEFIFTPKWSPAHSPGCAEDVVPMKCP
jgi:hypothetical protein